MKNVFRFLSYTTFLVILSGCGGNGSGTGVGMLWQGSWSGNTSMPTIGQSGTLTLNVGPDGAVNGTGTNTTLSQNYNLSGFILEDGSINWILSGDRTGTITGSIVKASSGHMTGVVSEQNGASQPINVNLDLAPL